jgi:hypothetical protein
MFVLFSYDSSGVLLPEKAKEYFRERVNSGDWWILTTDNILRYLPVFEPFLVEFYGNDEASKKASIISMAPRDVVFVCRSNTRENMKIAFPGLTFIFCHKSVCPAARVKTFLRKLGCFPPNADLSAADMFYLLKDVDRVEDVMLLIDSLRKDDSVFSEMENNLN